MLNEHREHGAMAQKPMDKDITQLLASVRDGDKGAESRLIDLVYRELRVIASRYLRGERKGHTLQTTALVNEAYVRMAGHLAADWNGRAHFFATAAQVMRNVLTDYARHRGAAKCGGGMQPVPFDETLAISEDRLDDILAIEHALCKLEKIDPRSGRVVVLRFYGGLSIDDIAKVLNIAPRTVKRDWNYSRAWLRAELGSEAAHESPSEQS
jgi:RNA polymerase sigma factor (TIGR02999 family)